MEEFNDIISDRVHGSRYIAKRFLSFVIENEVSPGEISLYTKEIVSTYTDMGIFEWIDRELRDTHSPFKKAKLMLDRLDSVVPVLVSKLRKAISSTSTLATLSHSNLVRECLEQISYKKLYCLRSDPGGEGIEMAKQLDGEVVNDEDGLKMLAEGIIDVVLVGCDQYSTHHIINKIGTGRVLEQCKETTIPLFVLASLMKYRSSVAIPTHPLLERVEIVQPMIVFDNQEK